MKEFVQIINVNSIEHLNSFTEISQKLEMILRMEETHHMENKKVIVKIDSPGGVVRSAHVILELFSKLEEKGWIIQTEVYNLAASMGSIFSQAGTKGHRYMCKTGSLMFHNLSTGFPAGPIKYETLHDQYIECTKMNDELQAYLIRNCKVDLRTFAAMVWNKDYYMGIEESMELGFIDHIS